jgi:hypothetical protein
VASVFNKSLGFTRKVSYFKNLNEWKGMGKEDEWRTIFT